MLLSLLINCVCELKCRNEWLEHDADGATEIDRIPLMLCSVS